MVTLDENFLADLFTQDSTLADLMLAEYPEKIKPEQYKVDRSEAQHLYFFYDLSLQCLNKFLSDKDTFEYELRNSRTGNTIRVNYLSSKFQSF